MLEVLFRYPGYFTKILINLCRPKCVSDEKKMEKYLCSFNSKLILIGFFFFFCYLMEMFKIGVGKHFWKDAVCKYFKL